MCLEYNTIKTATQLLQIATQFTIRVFSRKNYYSLVKKLFRTLSLFHNNCMFLWNSRLKFFVSSDS